MLNIELPSYTHAHAQTRVHMMNQHVLIVTL